MSCFNNDSPQYQLKLDVLGQWIEQEWIPQRGESNLVTLWTTGGVVDVSALGRFKSDFPLPNDFRFVGLETVPCPVAAPITSYNYNGEFSTRSGAFLYRFANPNTDETFEALVASAFHNDDSTYYITVLVCLPENYAPVWTVYAKEMQRLSSGLEPSDEVVVIGGRSSAFKPTVEWDDIILPKDLKDELMHDVRSFFSKGIEVYHRLKLKPFRKLLLAGVPGTGKTMLCSALARWALDNKFVVVYISSGDRHGSTFSKIDHALAVAADSEVPAMIILEELDAYLNDEDEKALILNVLDGAEATMNDKGTLLISTTNHPEAIDDRVLKRPGRLDRVFIIPQANDPNDAEKMLRQYLGDLWQDDHRDIARQLTGYPGAFIREVAVYAMTRVAYENGDSLSVELLENSFDRLREQIDARDDFLTRRSNFGLIAPPLGAVAGVQ